jgi:ABC-type xylose transport system permease subunit
MAQSPYDRDPFLAYLTTAVVVFLAVGGLVGMWHGFLNSD